MPRSNTPQPEFFTAWRFPTAAYTDAAFPKPCFCEPQDTTATGLESARSVRGATIAEAGTNQQLVVENVVGQADGYGYGGDACIHARELARQLNCPIYVYHFAIRSGNQDEAMYSGAWLLALSRGLPLSEYAKLTHVSAPKTVLNPDGSVNSSQGPQGIVVAPDGDEHVVSP